MKDIDLNYLSGQLKKAHKFVFGEGFALFLFFLLASSGAYSCFQFSFCFLFLGISISLFCIQP